MKINDKLEYAAFRILVDRESAAVVRACHRVLGDLTEAEEELLRRFAEKRGDSVAPADAGFLSRIRSAFR